MNELVRTQYLGAMGIDSYISRAQLPGAANTRRLVVVPSVVAHPQEVGTMRDSQSEVAAPLADTSKKIPMPQIADFSRTNAGVEGSVGTELGSNEPSLASVSSQVRFSLAAVIVGNYVWLEELPNGTLATAQVQLIQGMARALGVKDKPAVSQFDWPMHNNQQLDLGVEAAKASVGGFLQRHIDQRHCTALVLLGDDVVARVALETMGDIRCVTTLSTAHVLANPAVKKAVWKDLKPLLG